MSRKMRVSRIGWILARLFGNFWTTEKSSDNYWGRIGLCFDESYRRKFFFEKGNFFEMKVAILNYYF